MAYLKNLKVDKVSFVKNAATKRKFLLLKSADSVEGDPNNANPQLEPELSKGEKGTMPDPVKDKVGTEGAGAGKADGSGTTDTQPAQKTAGTADPTPSSPSPTPPAPAVVNITKEEFDALVKSNKSLEEKLQKAEDFRRREAILKWLNDECSYLPLEASAAADKILALEKQDPEAAKMLQESFKAASLTVSQSSAFGEVGSSRDASSDSLATPYMAAIQKALDEVKKSSDPKVKKSEAVADAIRGLGSAAYRRYRDEHILRAKTTVGSNS